MAELEGLEEKLSAIWYIETPTHFISGLGNLTKLRPPEVNPYFEKWKSTLGGVTKNFPATILTWEQNCGRKIFRYTT